MSKLILTSKMIKTVLDAYYYYDKYAFYTFSEEYYLVDDGFDNGNDQLIFRHDDTQTNIYIYTEKPVYENTEVWFRNAFMVFYDTYYFNNTYNIYGDMDYSMKYFMTKKLTFEDFKTILYEHEIYNEAFADEVDLK